MSRPPQPGVRHHWPDPSKTIVAIVTVAVVGMLLAMFDPVFLYNDAFQHVSATRALLDGEGYSTSIVYYEQNYSQGGIPVPQTVWPPGTALSAASLAIFGLDPIWSVFLVSVLGIIAAPALMLLIARCTQLSAAEVTVTSLSTVSLGLLIYVTLLGGTEPAFLASTLLALLGACGLARDTGPQYPAIAAIIAGTMLAVLFRYNGLFLVVSTGMWFVYRALTHRSWRPVYQALMSLTPSVIVGVVLLGRNLRLTGSLTGGPASESWASPGEVLGALVEAVVSTSGLNPTSTHQLGLLIVLGLMLLVSMFLLVTWIVRLLRRNISDALPPGTASEVVMFCMFYLAVTLAMLLLVLAPRALDALGYRYLLPLVPFLVLIIVITWHEHKKYLPNDPRRQGMIWTLWSRPVISVAAVCIVLYGNALAFNSAVRALHDNSAARDIPLALEAQLETGESLLAWLGNRVSVNAPLLSSSAQRVGGLTGWPMLGLTPGMYSSSEWPSERVREVVREFGVCYVLLHATDTEAVFGGGRSFFADLRRGRVPPWLSLTYESPLLRIYVVEDCEALPS